MSGDARYWVMEAVRVEVVYRMRMRVVSVQKGPAVSDHLELCAHHRGQSARRILR